MFLPLPPSSLGLSADGTPLQPTVQRVLLLSRVHSSAHDKPQHCSTTRALLWTLRLSESDSERLDELISLQLIDVVWEVSGASTEGHRRAQLREGHAGSSSSKLVYDYDVMCGCI